MKYYYNDHFHSFDILRYSYAYVPTPLRSRHLSLCIQKRNKRRNYQKSIFKPLYPEEK